MGGIMWPYGGVGFLLSSGAADALVHGRATLDGVRPHPCPQRRLSVDGSTVGSIRAHEHPHALQCLRMLTCPWGASRRCTSLPPPFNHTMLNHTTLDAAASIETQGAARQGFCALRAAPRHFNNDCHHAVARTSSLRAAWPRPGYLWRI